MKSSMSSVLLFLPFLLFACVVFLPSARAQVPRACVQNVTQVNATCCPPATPGGAACGGASRGRCQAIEAFINGTRQSLTGAVSDVYDSRMEWPIHLFQYSCRCSFFYTGIACEKSKLGAKGPGVNPFANFFRPSKNMTRVRRDVANLTKAERQHVRDVLVRAKKDMSDWVILNDTSTKPITYFNVSVYDFFVFLNYYATRGLNLRPGSKLKSTVPLPDLAHNGPNFVPWHRKYLTDFEEALDAISKNITLTANPSATVPPFALPYWNWTEKEDCDACTDDLAGATDVNDPDGHLSTTSPFSNWHVLCDNRDANGHPCDPKGDRPQLWRTYSDDERFAMLPSLQEVNFTLNAPTYDVEPFNQSANASSFRNLLEGYIGPDNNATAAKMGQRYMGMKVRNFLNGTWTDLALGPNDPLFWFHQAFMDKLFTDWEAAASTAGTDVTKLPDTYVARPGEDRSENMAPFLPPVGIGQALHQRKLFATGYSYDTSVAKKSAENEYTSFSSIVGAILGMTIIIAGIVIGLIFFRRRRRVYSEVQMLAFEPIPEKQPLLMHRSRHT